MVLEEFPILGEKPREGCAELGRDRAFFGEVKKRVPRHAQPRPRKAAQKNDLIFMLCRMNPGDPRPLLDRHAARILARWREQLRALPPSSALAAPELLVSLMAPAIARVRHESSLAGGAASGPPESTECRCGLNPLAAFYLTGEVATFEVLWAQPDALAPLSPEMRESACRVLRTAWRKVAAEEVSLFCGLCQRGAAIEASDAAHHSSRHHHQPQAHPTTRLQPEDCLARSPEKLTAWERGASAIARDKS
jgi:hypothetical protein